MDATTFAAMRLAEHRFADLELENHRRMARAERRAALAHGVSRPAVTDREAPPLPAPSTPAGLALAGPSS